MDVLIIERDEQMGSLLADTLDGKGISFAVASDDEPCCRSVGVAGFARKHKV
jgi:hypothetical protein